MGTRYRSPLTRKREGDFAVGIIFVRVWNGTLSMAFLIRSDPRYPCLMLDHKGCAFACPRHYARSSATYL